MRPDARAEVVQVLDEDGEPMTREEIAQLLGEIIGEIVGECVAAEIRRLRGRVD